MARNATRFYSGTTTFWIDWEEKKVVAWLDSAHHGENGTGLPAEFTLTDKARWTIAEYIATHPVDIEVPDYTALEDVYMRTYDIVLHDAKKAVYSRISRNGNIVLLHGLSPSTAYKWLMAVLCDYEDLAPINCKKKVVEETEHFGDLYTENEQGGDE